MLGSASDPHLPPGLNELYFHPAASRDALLTQVMPDYEQARGTLKDGVVPVFD